MTSAPLPHDPLWPRAGGWPAGTGSRADLAVIGVPTWRTSLSTTGAHATPAAVRDALRRYSPALIRGADGAPVDLGELDVVDHGDVRDPDGPDGEARARAAVGEVLAGARALVALGGDNALTVPVALGAWGDDVATALADAVPEIRARYGEAAERYLSR